MRRPSVTVHGITNISTRMNEFESDGKQCKCLRVTLKSEEGKLEVIAHLEPDVLVSLDTVLVKAIEVTA